MRNARGIVGVVRNDLARGIGIGLFDFVDRNLVGITLLFRVQRDAKPARSHERTQTFKHSPTVLKPTGKCNQAVSVESDRHRNCSQQRLMREKS